eukprot:g13523.t1
MNASRWRHGDEGGTTHPVVEAWAVLQRQGSSQGARCCMHHQSLKSACRCLICKTTMRKAVEARGGGGAGAARAARGQTCQGFRAGFVSQQQTVESHGGVSSAVGSLCPHAKLALEHMTANTMKKATSVRSEGIGIRDYDAAKELVKAAKSSSHLTTEEYNDVMSIVEGAERSGVWPVVETERHQYMVLDMRSRTTELDWGSVKLDQVAEGGASRRLTSSRNFMCKAVKGEACTENKNKKRSRCVHTLTVAVFAGIGLGSSTGGGGAAAGGSSGGSGVTNTPRMLLDEDAEMYRSRLADLLAYIWRFALLPTAPSGLAPLSDKLPRKFVVFQTKCACGGELLAEKDVDGTLLTEEPLIVSVKVERRKCTSCGACAWASDNWQETSVFNYNNYHLVEVSLLYKCLDQFITGTTIQSFFAAHLGPLKRNIRWLRENPALAKSITETDSRFLSTLSNVFLGFLAVIDFPFEFRCFQWGSHSEILTADACVKMSLHKLVFGTKSPNGLQRLDDYKAKFYALFNDGDCSKDFLGGRGGVATAGMVCVFTPAGVMVAWKVLPTAESPYDIVDFMAWQKVHPYLLSYDAACKVVKGLEKYCPGLLKDKTGALQRDEGGKVVFPDLAHVGNNSKSAAQETAHRTFQDIRRTNDHEDVYAVMETAGPRPGLQSEVDPDEALSSAAESSEIVGVPSRQAATRALGALHRDGVRVLSLFEVLVFTYHWHREAAGEATGGGAGGAPGGAAGGVAGGATAGGPGGAAGGLVVGANGWVVQAPGEGGEGGGVTHADAADFLLPVLVGLSGSRQASGVSALPKWLDGMDATCFSGGGLETALRRYAKAKVDFVVGYLKPLTTEARERAENAVRGGVGFGRGVYALKGLELILAQNVAPHATTTEEGKMAGYDAIWRDTRYKNFEGSPLPREMCIGPDGHHENNHGEECRKLYSGLTTCKDIGGVNLTRHESDHGVKAMYLRSINNMTFANFTYSLSVINELQNRKYNRHFLGVLFCGESATTPHPACRVARLHSGPAAGVSATRR